MAFSSGFSAGLQIGRDRLDRKISEQRAKMAADELELAKRMQDWRESDAGANRDERSRIEAQRIKEMEEERRARAEEATAKRYDTRMAGITGQIRQMRADKDQYQANLDRRMDRIYRNSEHGASGGSGGKAAAAYRTVRREDPETGETITERYPIAVPEQGGMAQTQPTAAAEMDPVAATAAAEIKQRQQNIANMKVRKATEGNGGFFGFNTWQDDIDDEQAAIDRLQPLVGSPAQAQQAPSAPQAAPRQLPPAIQQQYDAQMAAPQKNPEAGAAPTGVRMLAPGGQVGMIPADQVEAALKKGYRRG